MLAHCYLSVAPAGTTRPQPSPSEAPVVQLGGPGQPNRELTDDEIAALETPTYGEADVQFVQSMIPHHAQALEMTGLVASRSDWADLSQLVAAHRGVPAGRDRADGALAPRPRRGGP